MPPCKSEDKRCALLQAALELFAAQGFDGTATAQIAKQAGVHPLFPLQKQGGVDS